MKHWYLIPTAAIAGLIVGAWGPTSDLEALKDMQAGDEVKREANAKSGFGTIANLVSLPDEARRPMWKPPSPDTNRVDSAGDTNRVETAAETNRTGRVHRPPRGPWDRKDLKNRIEEAKELWRTRCDLARAQWKAKLGIEGDKSARFDEMVDAMNADLKDLMAEFAAEVAERKEVTPELGVKMMSAVTQVLSEEYDALGECVDGDRRAEVSNLPLHEFIDPSFIEPMIQVQDYLEPGDFDMGPGPR